MDLASWCYRHRKSGYEPYDAGRRQYRSRVNDDRRNCPGLLAIRDARKYHGLDAVLPVRQRRAQDQGSPSMSLAVIGAGLGRTGTLSLKQALEQLGFGPCHHM
ncbi:MAG: sulfotransferase, partial [Dongiaceae bacterium]